MCLPSVRRPHARAAAAAGRRGIGAIGWASGRAAKRQAPPQPPRPRLCVHKAAGRATPLSLRRVPPQVALPPPQHPSPPRAPAPTPQRSRLLGRAVRACVEADGEARCTRAAARVPPSGVGERVRAPLLHRHTHTHMYSHAAPALQHTNARVAAVACARACVAVGRPHTLQRRARSALPAIAIGAPGLGRCATTGAPPPRMRVCVHPVCLCTGRCVAACRGGGDVGCVRRSLGTGGRRPAAPVQTRAHAGTHAHTHARTTIQHTRAQHAQGLYIRVDVNRVAVTVKAVVLDVRAPVPRRALAAPVALHLRRHGVLEVHGQADVRRGELRRRDAHHHVVASHGLAARQPGSWQSAGQGPPAPLATTSSPPARCPTSRPPGSSTPSCSPTCAVAHGAHCAMLARAHSPTPARPHPHQNHQSTHARARARHHRLPRTVHMCSCAQVVVCACRQNRCCRRDGQPRCAARPCACAVCVRAGRASVQVCYGCMCMAALPGCTASLGRWYLCAPVVRACRAATAAVLDTQVALPVHLYRQNCRGQSKAKGRPGYQPAVHRC